MGLDPRAMLDAAGVLGGLTGLAALWRSWGEHKGAKALRQNEVTQREVDVLKAALDALQASQARSQDEIAQLHARNVFLSGKNDQAEARLDALLERLHQRELESAENRHLLEQQGDRLQILVNERRELQRRIAELEAKIAMLEQTNRLQEETIRQQREMIDQLKQIEQAVKDVRGQVSDGQ